MRWRICAGIEQVAARDWNRLCGDENPFVRHEFLLALERHGCVDEASGWQPMHLLVHERGSLAGAVPMYLKHHSYGEFVFDWAWAEAYQRHGRRYYPKLVVAVPFTPVPGPRLLVAPGPHSGRVRRALIEACIEFAEQSGVSSLHWLFTDSHDSTALTQPPLLQRLGCQYHWHNDDYQSFGAFLDNLRSKKRKQIRRERRQARESGLVIETLTGDRLGNPEWEAFHAFYRSTYDRKWGYPSLTLEFFKALGATMAEQVVLVLARDGQRYVAGAFCLRGANTLYGRNWGCIEYHPSLHYEMCYYQLIDYCIANRLQRFEAGAQGEHKISRGFVPVQTWSSHWIRDLAFRDAIAEFLERERTGMTLYQGELEGHSPYKPSSLGNPPRDRIPAQP